MTENYDFQVVREPLYRADRTDTRHDVLFRADGGAHLGVVGRKYQLVRHKEAADFVFSILDKLKLKFDEPEVALVNSGQRMDMSIKFPTKRFDPTPKKVGDEFDPMIIVQNSYDMTRALGITFGVNRLVCLNGAVVLRKTEEIRARHIGENINFDVLAPIFETRIEETIKKMKGFVKKLSVDPGLPYLKLILAEALIAAKYKEKMLEALGNQIIVQRDDKKKVKRVMIARGTDAFTAYTLWNILTQISSHEIHAIQRRRATDHLIANRFFSNPK